MVNDSENLKINHPDPAKLKQYAARELKPTAMTAVILHLEECVQCFDVLQSISDFDFLKTEQSSIITEIEAEIFHLDYDEHLRPFIDAEADAATREIVETHALNCANCAFQLRELRQFSESLRLRDVEKSSQTLSIFQRVGHFWSSLRQYPTLPIAGLFFIILSASLIWLKISGSNSFNQGSEFSKTIYIPQNNQLNSSQATIPENIPNSAEVNKDNAEKHTQQRLNGQREPVISKTITRSAKEVGEVDNLKDLPEQLRNVISSAMNSGRLALPEKLNEMMQLFKPRGGLLEKADGFSPDREILRETKPKFNWKVELAKNQFFIVEIYDENNTSVAVSPPLKKKYWVPENSLAYGKTYQWELRIAESGATTVKVVGAGKFSILDLDSQNKLRSLKSATTLQRGIIFASTGLIKDARREFIKALKSSQRSQARKFLRQLSKFP